MAERRAGELLAGIPRKYVGSIEGTNEKAVFLFAEAGRDGQGEKEK